MTKISMKIIISFLGIALISACVHDVRYDKTTTSSRKLRPGEWVNLHVGDPNLAGILIIQLPDAPREAIEYIDKHPCYVGYFFWDGRLRVTQFTPEGEKYVDKWMWDTPGSSYLWKGVDYSYGSDPSFRTHKDPRRNEAPPENRASG